MTREEALKLWCPMAREGGGEFPYNRIEGERPKYPKLNCLADGCACWVWDHKSITDGQVVERHGQVLPQVKSEGHCGLAR